MITKTLLFDTLVRLVNKSNLDESEKERLAGLLTEARFPTVEPTEMEQIALAAEQGRANLEREIAESGDPDMIAELNEDMEELDQIEFDSVVKAMKEAGILAAESGQVKRDGEWLLSNFAGLVQ